MNKSKTWSPEVRERAVRLSQRLQPGTSVALRRLLVFAVSLGALGCRAAEGEVARKPVADTARVTAFVGVNVVPMDRERVLPDHTVLVRSGRISAIGPRDSVVVPSGAQRITATGKYLIPGLIDMHVHLLGEQSRGELALYVANGVTTVRNLHGEPYHLRWRDEIARGALFGPNLFSSGPFVQSLGSAVEAEGTVRKQKDAGYDFIKVRNGPSPSRYLDLARSARDHQLPIVGHAPPDMGLETVVRSGQRTLEHAENLMQVFFDEHQPDTAQIPGFVAQLHGSDVCVTPTLVVFDHIIRQTAQYPHTTDLLSRPEVRYVGPELRSSWQPGRNDYVTRWKGVEHEVPVALAKFRRQFAFMQALTRSLAEAGVPLLAGTDAPVAMVVPGFSLRSELQLLNEAGLRPFEVLRTATANAAACLDRASELGTLDQEKRADLVLLDRSPLDDLSNLAEPVGVMVRGTWFSRQALRDTLVARAKNR